MSTHVTESTEVLDSGFRPAGFRIPTLWILDSDPLDFGFRSPRFRIPTLRISDSDPLDFGFRPRIPLFCILDKPKLVQSIYNLTSNKLQKKLSLRNLAQITPLSNILKVSQNRCMGRQGNYPVISSPLRTTWKRG